MLRKKSPFSKENFEGLEVFDAEVIEKAKFNLLYHITPIKNKYQWNLNEILKREAVFENGKMVFAVSQDVGLDSVEHVKKYLPEEERGKVEIFTVENHPVYRETVSLAPLLDRVRTDKDSYTFYAHTKGITRGNNPAIKLWTTAMYQWNLDNMSLVYSMLQKYPVAGCFKRINKKCPDAPKIFKLTDWHYSGTFFWFRNDRLFSKYNWRAVSKDRYGTETYLAKFFKTEEAGVLLGDDCPSLYKLNNVRKIVYAP